jgi:hypothetical protein
MVPKKELGELYRTKGTNTRLQDQSGHLTQMERGIAGIATVFDVSARAKLGLYCYHGFKLKLNVPRIIFALSLF